MKDTMRTRLLIFVLCCPALAACGRTAMSPTPVDPASAVTPIERTGPVTITFATANPLPGSTVTGCGPRIAGCEGRLRVTLDLLPQFDGPVLYVRVYLHSMRNGVACLSGTTAPMTLAANRHATVDVTLDTSDVCATPETMATMDAIVEGPVQTASRQAWSLRYVFAP